MILAALALAAQLANPGFERGLDGWQVEAHRGIRAYPADNRHDVVRQSAEGEAYVTMGWRARSAAPPGAGGRLFQRIDARRYRGRTIRVSAQARAPGFAHRNGSLIVSAGAANARALIAASEHWRRHGVTVRVPRDARTIEIAFQVEGTQAELAVDDVRLRILR
ncbi:MAG TPA: hypothetical protein VEC11_06020 [Allosphingosinicella sp.]|nr:hypothetical protein [Allosphingosinicella sp.]